MTKYILCLLLLWAGSAQAATVRYASPSGTGSSPCTTNTDGGACSVATGIAALVAGDTLNLRNGTYTGASGAITVNGKKGSSGSQITIKALNDGGAFIDGGFARNPIEVWNSSWINVEGFNACCGANASDAVVYASGTDINFRRIVAWDINGAAAGYVFIAAYGDRILMEDVAGFGKGRVIMGSYKSNHVTYRRAFAYWMQGKDVNPSGGPQSPMQMDYDSINDTWENVIGTTNWTGAGADQFNGGGIGIHSGTSWGVDRLLGSLFYNTAGQGVGTDHLFITDWCQPGVHPGCTPYWTDPWGGTHTEHGFNFKDVIFYSAQSMIPIETLDRGPCPTCSIVNTTTVSATPNNIGGPWPIQTNFHHYSTLTAMNSAGANPFQSSAGTGARVCKRYVDGVLTTTGLWPWPMDDRIKAAFTATGRTPSAYFAGSAGSGYAANTVTSQMVALFGAIPATCTQSGIVPTLAVTITVPATDPYPTPPALYQNNSIVFQGTAIP